jgi:hypothetical protein
MLTAIIDPRNAAGQGRPFLAREPLIRDDFNRGVKWAFDLSRPHCYGGVTPVANGAAIRNLAETYAERNSPVAAGDTVIGGTVSFAGGGMDFSAVAAHGNYVRGPATAAAAIWANGQYFLSATVLKLPTAADWPEGTAVTPIHTWTAGNSGYAANLDIATTGMQKSAGTPVISVVRQHGTISGFSSTGLVPVTASLGGFAMVASWRTSTEMNVSITTPLGTVTGTPVLLATNNSTDFSALRPLRGIAGNLWQTEIANDAQKWKLYAGFDDAISLDGRNIQTILDNYWAEAKAKWDAGVYS